MSLLAVCVLALAAAAPSGGTLPLDLAPLADLLDDEVRAVEAARAYDLYQRDMIEWDRFLVEKHEAAGDVVMVDGVRERLRRRLETVTQAHETVLARYPRNARALNNYGDFLYDVAEDQGRAVNLWHLASRLDPAYSAPLNNLGLHYVHMGLYERGLKYVDEALKLEPENPDYLFNVVQIYLVHFHALQSRFEFDKKKLYREAMKLSKKATTLDPGNFEFAEDYAANFYAGERFDVKVNWHDAAAAWQRARSIAPNPDRIFYCWLNEARVWIRAKKLDRARKALAEAFAINPDSAAVKNLLESLNE